MRPDHVVHVQLDPLFSLGFQRSGMDKFQRAFCNRLLCSSFHGYIVMAIATQLPGHDV